MIRLADASAEASKVEHCSTFAASHASYAPRRFPRCISAKSDVTPFKVNGEASTHAAVWTGRKCVAFRGGARGYLGVAIATPTIGLATA